MGEYFKRYGLSGSGSLVICSSGCSLQACLPAKAGPAQTFALLVTLSLAKCITGLFAAIRQPIISITFPGKFRYDLTWKNDTLYSY
jgi:hypothetical protein